LTPVSQSSPSTPPCPSHQYLAIVSYEDAPVANVERAGIVGRERERATVRPLERQRRERDMLPVSTPVLAAEHPDPPDDVDRARLGRTHHDAVEVHRVVDDVETLGDALPAPAPVQA